MYEHVLVFFKKENWLQIPTSRSALEGATGGHGGETNAASGRDVRVADRNGGCKWQRFVPRRVVVVLWQGVGRNRRRPFEDAVRPILALQQSGEADDATNKCLVQYVIADVQKAMAIVFPSEDVLYRIRRYGIKQFIQGYKWVVAYGSWRNLVQVRLKAR